ncbi:MAG: hypothetical protein JW815_02160 [Candidatus Bathyarchaeota archaeon]|nr:hypothetical protein [Candidatus Bathyarchaeum sp.]
MKRFEVLYGIVSFSLVLSLFCGVGNALEQTDLTSYVVLTTQNAYPDHNIIAAIYIKNSNSSDILTIQYVGIQFDWMASDQFFGYDLSSDPIVLAPSAEQFLDSINILVPEDATVGEHSYFVGIDGLEGAKAFSWDSETFTLIVQDPDKKECSVLLNQVSSNITTSENKNFQSSTAQSLLDQAKNAYEEAITFGDQSSWDEAVSMLNNALTYIGQADVADQQYVAEQSSQRTMLITLGVAAVAIVAILAIFYLMKRNKEHKISPQTKNNAL